MSAAEPFSATRPPRLMMFDLDDTLVDSVPNLTAVVDSMLASPGRLPASIERIRQWIGKGTRVLMRHALAGNVEHDDIDREEAEAALALFMEAYANSHAPTEVYPGVVDTLKWLRRNSVKMALIANRPGRFVTPLLGEVKLGYYFRWITGGDTLPQQKPNSTALLFVVKMVGIEPEDALFVGDSHNDVPATKAAGVCCATLTYGYNHGRPTAEEAPTLIIDNLRDLLPCADRTVEIVLPNDSLSPSNRRGRAMAVNKLWMKVIKALARWRWCV